MPLVLFLLLVILIAQFGFWDTFQGVLGAAAMVVLLVLLLVAIIGLGGWYALQRLRR
jgi:hypothetical protein